MNNNNNNNSMVTATTTSPTTTTTKATKDVYVIDFSEEAEQPLLTYSTSSTTASKTKTTRRSSTMTIRTPMTNHNKKSTKSKKHSKNRTCQTNDEDASMNHTSTTTTTTFPSSRPQHRPSLLMELRKGESMLSDRSILIDNNNGPSSSPRGDNDREKEEEEEEILYHNAIQVFLDTGIKAAIQIAFLLLHLLLLTVTTGLDITVHVLREIIGLLTLATPTLKPGKEVYTSSTAPVKILNVTTSPIDGGSNPTSPAGPENEGTINNDKYGCGSWEQTENTLKQAAPLVTSFFASEFVTTTCGAMSGAALPATLVPVAATSVVLCGLLSAAGAFVWYNHSHNNTDGQKTTSKEDKKR